MASAAVDLSPWYVWTVPDDVGILLTSCETRRRPCPRIELPEELQDVAPRLEAVPDRVLEFEVVRFELVE